MPSFGGRIESIISFRNSQNIEARGTLLKLTRTTVAFEVYNPYSIVQLSEVLHELTIYRNDKPIYRGKAVVNTLVNTGLMLIVSATLVDQWFDLFDLVKKPEALNANVRSFIADWNEAHQLVPSFQLVVSEMRSFFSEMNRWLEQMSISETQQDTDENAQIDFIQKIEEPFLQQILEYWGRFEEEAKKIPTEHTVNHKRYVQMDLHPLIMTSPFVHRTYHKPLGYAGDYEMVNMLLNAPYKGPSIYAKLINKAFMFEGMGKAHRNRIDILEEKISDVARRSEQENRKAKILNIGCGPAAEVQRFLKTEGLAERIEFILLDFNDQTLEFTKSQLSQIKQEYNRETSIEYVHQSVHTLLKQYTAKKRLFEDEQFDMVYCAGLFDYLSDKICTRLIDLCYRWTKADGSVLLTNVHPVNPGINVMEYMLEWHLVYRDEAQMTDLYKNKTQQRVYTDDTGFNVFLEIYKDGGDHRQSRNS